MLRRFARDESGMTMGLVVIMIVLIGVMGAGLLTFVQRDLQSVIEVNRGQKSIEVTDAGIQAAKRQLLAVSFPESYNGAVAGDPVSKAESEWSASSPSTPCAGRLDDPGKCITTTTEGNVRVTIRYLPPPTNLLGVGAGSKTDPNFAPEDLPVGSSDYPDKRDYFRVEADGIFSGARRKVRAIMVTEDLGLPKAYFATENINMGSSATATTIENVSLFARNNVTGIRAGMLLGTDSAYGNWVTSYNNRARLGNATLAADATGAAAETSVTYAPTVYNNAQRNAPAAATDRYKRLDFDNGAGTATPSPNYKFCDKNTTCWPAGTAQPPNVITYPFNDESKLDANFLQGIAEQQVNTVTGQDNYVVQAGGTVNIDQDSFYQVTPALSSVYVVRFTGATTGLVNIRPTGSSTDCPIKGTILVLNGDINTSSLGASCFDGIVSLQDPNNLGTLDYTNVGDFTLNGFVNIEGTMTIQGSVDPILGGDVLNAPGYHNVKIWSWRECYNTTCS